jgi:putative transposase
MPDRPGHLHRHRFPTEIIAHAVWLYHRFALSFRDVEELLFERGIVVTHESIRGWVRKLGERFAAGLRRRERRCGRTWHLDEVFGRIGGEQRYLWRAVNEHGKVLDVLVQERRDADAAERFFRRLLGHAETPPERIVTEGLVSFGAALPRPPELDGVEHLRVRSAARANNRVEQSHLPTRLRERRMQGFLVHRLGAALSLPVQPCLQSVPSAPSPPHGGAVPRLHAGSISDVERDHGRRVRVSGRNSTARAPSCSDLLRLRPV